MSKQGKLHVVVSGFFNPPHCGHIFYLQAAKELAQNVWLTVILNNKEQIELKGSVPFYSDKDRLAILNSIKYVDEVVWAIDKDSTVCQTLKILTPDVFANGGDRAGNDFQATAEEVICKEIGCRVIYGVGGHGKYTSSSFLIKRAANWYREHNS